ncbi:MAG TPA: hypothetical protein VF443_08770 [Nitrospira sp.]
MLEYDPKANLRQYPMPMIQFGSNPYGEPLYRIVFASSRRMLAGGTDGFHWVPAYRQIGDRWVLERWHDPWKFTQCTKEVWERQYMHILGPYPDRGEYAHVFTFEAAPPDQCNIGKLISWVEEGQRRSWQDNRDACQAEYDAEERAGAATRDAICRDSVSAFGVAPFSGGAVSRSQKSAPLRKSANELGLPTGNNKFMQLRRA